MQLNNWTYGVEHELANWDCNECLPSGCSRTPDYTIVNSNGIAAPPNPKVYGYGGEIITPPSASIYTQVQYLDLIKEWFPKAAVNYRSNLHIHIRVPGLKDDLKLLKKLQYYIHQWMPKLLPQIEPIPIGLTPAQKKRERRRKISHHTLLTNTRLLKQLAATTTKEFFENEVPRSKVGKPMWHAQPRLCGNLRQMLQTDTVEFRHFPGTLDGVLLHDSFIWCEHFLRAALQGVDPPDPAEYKFPKFPKFNEEQEIKYQATAAHNGLPQKEIAANIKLILKGEFSGSEAEASATALASGLSRKHMP